MKNLRNSNTGVFINATEVYKFSKSDKSEIKYECENHHIQS